jgi:alpha-N-arabinofuranosidase
MTTKRFLLIALVLCVAGCFAMIPGWRPPESGSPPPPPGPAFAASVRIDVLQPGRAAEPRLLGSNIQWVDHGDDLLQPGTNRMAPAMQDKVLALGPTSLRYPGGSQASVHRWRNGMGPLEKRGGNQHFFSTKEQPTRFGTVEFLDLCRLTKAEPFISVNVLTGTPEEAVDWLKTVNAGLKGPDGSALPKVTWWEIDNEPYLREDMQKSIALEPAAFARKADLVIAAMRAADPTVKLGLPLRSDTVGGIPATHFPGYADTVLAQVKQPVDFIALHNAYLPIVVGQPAPDHELFRAAMAGYRAISADLDHTRRLCEKHRGKRLPLAITEFNAMFSHGGGPTDGYTATHGGALIVADLLRLMSEQDDIVMAHFWSLSGNGVFGAISNRGRIRPSYRVLQGFRDLLQGNYVSAAVESPTFASIQVGIVPAQQDVPLIAVRATLTERTMRVMVLNKDWSRPAKLTLNAGRMVDAAQARVLTGTPVFAPTDSGAESDFVSLATAGAGTDAITCELPAAAVAFLTLTLR